MKLDTNRIIGLYAPQNYGKTYMMTWLVSVISQHCDVYVYDTNFERYVSYRKGNLNRIKFLKAKDITKQETPEFLNQGILKIRSMATNCFIVIEDIDKMVEGSSKTKETLEVFKLASDSRHQRIGIIYATKEPVNIPVKLRANTNLFFIGQFIEPAHVKTLSAFIDKKTLRELKKPEFIMLDRYDNTTRIITLNNDKLSDVHGKNTDNTRGEERAKAEEGGEGRSGDNRSHGTAIIDTTGTAETATEGEGAEGRYGTKITGGEGAGEA